MDPTRRELLRSAGLIPVVFGLAALSGGDATALPDPPAPPPPPDPKGDADGKPWSPKDGPPPWWTSAYDAMRDLGRDGVAIRIPKDPAVAKALGTTLVDLCARGTLDQRLLFAEAVFVCLTSAQIETLLLRAKPEDDAILFDHRPFDPKPHRIEGAAIPAGDAADGARLGETLRALVEGAKGERLAASAAARRKDATKEQLAAYDALAVDADGGLAYGFPAALVPALLSERRTTEDLARRARIDAALSRSLDVGEFGSSRVPVEQPFGVEMAHRGGTCGSPGEMVACGMSMPIPSSYRFLHYLTSNA